MGVVYLGGVRCAVEVYKVYFKTMFLCIFKFSDCHPSHVYTNICIRIF